MTDTPQNQEQTYRFPLRRPVTTMMLFLTLAVFGFRSYQQLSINLMPDISYPTLTVRTEYEGAAPEDVEKLVTRPLEELLSIVGGMVEISSISSAGLSEVILEFTWDTDMKVAQQDVRDRLDLFSAPRELTEKPVILRYDPTLDPVMRVAITPSMPNDRPVSREETYAALTSIRDSAERQLKSDLEAESGIAQVAIKGGQELEVQVLVDAERLKSLGLSLSYLVSSLEQQNINLSGGTLKEGKTEYLVRTLNEFQDVAEIGDSIVSIPTGEQYRFSELADVFLGSKERDAIVHRNGLEAVALDVFKEGDANTVRVCNKVKDLLGLERPTTVVDQLTLLFQESMKRARLRRSGSDDEEANDPVRDREKSKYILQRLPDNVNLALISDQSRFILGAIDEVKDAVIIGGILALIILFMFLRDMKSTLIIGIAIPISVIATFIPMFARGISLNIMSLGGLALGVGMLVDNSIVVLESIFRCREEGDDARDAANRGTSEVGSAVTASTFTTICVFLPIAFVEGVAGQMFGDLALTVTFALLASLLTALFLVPLLASSRGVAVRGGDHSLFWIVRAYRDITQSQDNGPDTPGADSTLAQAIDHAAGLVLASPKLVPVGSQYARQYVQRLAFDLFGSPLRAFAVLRERRSSLRLASATFYALLLPILAALFLVQLTVRSLGAILETGLLLLCIPCYIAWVVCRYVLAALLWLPLTAFDVAFRAFRDAYAAILQHALRFGAVLLLLTVLLAADAGYRAVTLGRELIPPMKQGEFGIRMEARPGTRLDETEERAHVIEEIIRNRPDVDSVTVEIGESLTRGQSERGENVADFTVLLKDPDVNAERQDEIIDELRAAVTAALPEDFTFTLPSLFSFKTAVELQVVGDDIRQLRDVGERALAAIREVPGIADAELSVKAGYPEIIVELDRELLANYGLSAGQVANRLRTEVQGDVATRFNQGGERIDVRVRTDQQLLRTKEDLYRLSVADGAIPIPLSDVARITVQEGPSEIRRIDQRQVVIITANVEGRDLGAVSNDMRDALRLVEKPRDFYFIFGGQNRELETSYASLRFALLLAVFLVYVVMACQFESIWHPALVMFSVPLAFVGVIYTLLWYEIDVSIMVFLGGIVLAGIVVNDAIVLVDYINQLRARGMKKRDAIVEAGKVRLRPIIMTTVTTVLGLLPMILASGAGAELRRPMAVTVMAGLTSATVLTLIVIPVVYDLFGGRDKA